MLVAFLCDPLSLIHTNATPPKNAFIKVFSYKIRFFMFILNTKAPNIV